MKYYVTSGDLCFVCQTETAKEAAITAITQNSSKELGLVTVVSEQGFGMHDSDMWFCTVQILKESNLLDRYVRSEWAS